MTKEKLEQLKEMLDATRKLISIDIYYCIYDTDCIVQYIYPEDGEKDGIYVGSRFNDPTGKLDEVLRTEKCIHNFIPMESFGFAMEGNLLPVYDDGELCGVISSAYVPMNQQQLAAREMAVQAIYYLIMSIDLKNKNHCTRLYFDYEKQQFPTDAQHFDDFCEKSKPYVHPEDLAQFMEFTDTSKVLRRIQNEKTFSMECRLMSVSGDYRWAELIFTRTDEFDSSGTEYGAAVYMVRDIHERKSKELDVLARLERKNQMLFEQGMTDELTKLYNRKGHVWFGENLLETAKRNGLYIYTMAADLNGLKYINDKFGHDEGDKAIRAIAEILKAAVPESAVVSRTGGDEFTVMAILEENSSLPNEVEKKLVDGMKEFNEKSGLPYIVQASYGWDFRPASEIPNLDSCVNRADNKMYDMKFGGRATCGTSGKLYEEISRRFGSIKQTIFILSADGKVQQDVPELFDSNYTFIALGSVEEAERRLAEYEELALIFVDARQGGLEFVRNMAKGQRKNIVPIMLLEEENDDAVAEAFELGAVDVLIQPCNTLLNKWRVKNLSRINATNQKLSQMLEQRMQM